MAVRRRPSGLNALVALPLVLAAGAALAQPSQRAIPRPSVPTAPPTATPAAPVAAPVRTAPTPAPDPFAGQVLIEADSVGQDPQTGVITAEGKVEARYEGRTVRADRLIYDQSTRRARAIGNVVIIEADGTTTYASEADVDDRLESGVAAGFSARLENNATLISRALVREPGGRNTLSLARYTACNVCNDPTKNPTWAVRARSAAQDTENQMISYRDVVLEVEGVPVFYAPYFSHPDPTSKRRSGFLAPDPGISSKRGFYWEQPYLWAISPYQDLTISPLISARVRPLLELEYRKRFWSGELRLQGSFTKERLFDSQGDKFGDDTWRSAINGDGKFAINKDWTWGFSLQRISDPTYLDRYDRDYGSIVGPFRSQSLRLLSQAFVQGQDDRFFARAAAVSIQSLRLFEDSGQIPNVLPLVEAMRVYKVGPWNGRLTVEGSALALDRGEGTDSARATAGVSWAASHIVGPGVVVEPYLHARADAFRYRNIGGPKGPDRDASRTLALGSVTARMPLIRPGAVTWLVEPSAMVGVGVGAERANRDVIAEDIGNFELDDTSILRPLGAPNSDLWEGGPRAALSISTRAQWGGTREAYASVARRWRDADRVSAFSRRSDLGGESTDYAVTAGLRDTKLGGIEARARLDRDDGSLQRLDVIANTTIGRLTARARYYETSADFGDRQRQADGFVSWKLNARTRAFGYIQRDLVTDTNILVQAGIGYDDECTAFRVFYLRSEVRNRFLGPSESIRFQVALSTLGALGDDVFD